MKTKKVNRYYCEYCEKANCCASAMKKHEERCTLNPKRVCGYCHLLEQEQPNIVEIIQLLPDINVSIYKMEWGLNDSLVKEATAKILPIIREKTGGCPACIMAVFRQAKIPLPLVEGFDFKKECQSIWSDFNDGQREDHYY